MRTRSERVNGSWQSNGLSERDGGVRVFSRQLLDDHLEVAGETALGSASSEKAV